MAGQSATRVATELAMRELRHDWRAAACFLAALVGVLAPLLILLALKNGVIGTMVNRLVEDPSNREIIAMGARSYDEAFFDALGARGDVGFVLPATRRINAAASALRNPVTRELERAVPLIPSAPGDPLLPEESAIAPGQVWLSASLAEQLALGPGQPIEMLIRREIDGVQETARVTFTVQGVASGELYSREAMFIALPDLLDIEAFRDDKSIALEAYAAPRPAPARYASFRLYARDLADLPGLLAALDAQEIQARPRAENATLLLAFRSNLNVLYLGIAVIATAGFWAAMAANLRGMVERQRVTFSLLKMLGLPPRGAAWLPLMQSVMLVLGGVVLTQLIVLPVLGLINLVFAQDASIGIARLGLGDVAATFALGLITAATAAIWAASAVQHIETSEVLRNG